MSKSSLFLRLLALSLIAIMATVSARASMLASPRMGSASYGLDWSAVGEISGGAGASAQYRLNATSGQMGAGTLSQSANFHSCFGFKCVQDSPVPTPTRSRTYLPALNRAN